MEMLPRTPMVQIQIDNSQNIVPRFKSMGTEYSRRFPYYQFYFLIQGKCLFQQKYTFGGYNYSAWQIRF